MMLVNLGLSDLPEDVFLDIAGQWMELAQILALRRVCRRLQKLTQIRELWIVLALRLVIARRLPWPQYASPLSTMPSETIERLTIRSVRMDQLWKNTQPDSAARAPAALIRCGRGQITWLHIVRSKWLVVGLKDCSMALWDMENIGYTPVATYPGTEGFVLSGVSQLTDHGLVLTVNTSMDKTYRFRMDIPFLGVQYSETLGLTNFVLEKSFAGYSKILDDYQGLLAFSNATNEAFPTLFDLKRETSVTLIAGERVTTLQYTIAVQIRPEVVIVVKDRNVELYSMGDIEGGLLVVHLDHQNQIRPLQSLAYPGDRMMWKVGLQPRSTTPSTTDPEPIVIKAHDSNGWVQWELQGGQHLTVPYAFPTSKAHKLNFVDNGIVKVCWGDSGQRVAYIGESRAPAAFCSFAFPPSELGHIDIMRWVLPFNSEDFPWLCDVDEAAGVSAVGTACGRIWIIDPSFRTERPSYLWEMQENA